MRCEDWRKPFVYYLQSGRCAEKMTLVLTKGHNGGVRFIVASINRHTECPLKVISRQ